MSLTLRWPSALLTRHSTPLAQNNVLRDDSAVFANPHAKTTLLLNLAAPLAQATGTAVLLTGAKKAAAGADASGYVAGFALASLLLPSLIERASKIEQKRWLCASQNDYDQAFAQQDSARPALWAMDKDVSGAPDSNQRSNRTYLFGARLRWGVFNEVNNVCDLSRAALEVGVALLLFSATIGPDVAVALAVGAGLMGGFGMLALGRTVERNEAITCADGALDGHLRRYYDNVELGNQNNYDRWREKFAELTSGRQELQAQRGRADALRGIAMLSLGRAPVAIALAWRLAAPGQGASSADLTRDIILQLPYLFAVTQRMVGCSELLTRQFLPSRAELNKSLADACQVHGLDLHQHIRPDEVAVHGPDGTCSFREAWPTLLAAAQSERGGRYTLTGDNGRGKSMALLSLKNTLPPEASMLVPANLRQLAFPLREGSTGERVIDALHVATTQGPRVLLLDEWEAHLDGNNRARLNQLFELLSAPKSQGGDGRLIVEITHQQR